VLIDVQTGGKAQELEVAAYAQFMLISVAIENIQILNFDSEPSPSVFC
jgi:hypothetical protein